MLFLETFNVHDIICLVVELLSIGVNARSHRNQPIQFIGPTGAMIEMLTLVQRNGLITIYFLQSHDLTLN